jgi:hypothetical protein
MNGVCGMVKTMMVRWLMLHKMYCTYRDTFARLASVS